MRIAMVSEHASPLAPLGGVDAGGQNVHVAELAAALVRRGHEVTVHTRRDDPGLPDRVETPSGVTVAPVAAGPAEPIGKDELLPYMGEFGRILAARFDAAPPDVVHAHFWMSGLAALSATRGTGIPVVQTFHALGSVKRRHQRDSDTSPPQRIRFERALANSVALTVATCSDEVFELARLGARRDRVTVVPCGVDTTHFTPAHGIPAQRPPRLLCVGRLVPRKGVDLVISALRSVPDTELVIAGGGPGDAAEQARLRAHTRRMGVADRVIFAGPVGRAAMPELLRSATAVVCTPWYEPFGMVALEAMACGVPVVAATVGGLTDTVVDGVTGLLVPPRSPAALAAALRRLTANPDLAAALGLAGADRARARYSWDRIAADTETAYARALPRVSAEAASR